MSNTEFPISTKNAPEAIKSILNAGLVPMLHGSPGVAKSSITQQIADDANLKLIDLRLSQCDPTDLAGFPLVKPNVGKAGYLPMDTFPIKGDELPENKNGWLLLLDEFNSASMAVQAAAYKLVLDRQVGQHTLHDRVAIVSAGNLSTDGAIVNRLSTAMQSRMVHLHINLDPEDWTLWASKNGLDHRVVSFIKNRPDLLHKFDPNHNDFTFPCARTWEFVSKIVSDWSTTDLTTNQFVIKQPIIAGTIGVGAASEFMSFCQIYKNLVTIEEILSDPEKTKVPDEPAILWALTGLIAHKINKQTIRPLIKYIERLPAEFQYHCLKTSIRRNPEIMDTPEFDQYTADNGEKLI